MSRAAVRIAATHGDGNAKVSVRCMRESAQNAEQSLAYPSCQETTDPSIVVTVSQTAAPISKR